MGEQEAPPDASSERKRSEPSERKRRRSEDEERGAGDRRDRERSRRDRSRDRRGSDRKRERSRSRGRRRRSRSRSRGRRGREPEPSYRPPPPMGRDDRWGGGQGGGQYGGGGYGGPPPPRMQQRPQFNDVCRDFMNGKCMRGDNCRYSHAGIDPTSGLAIGDDNAVPEQLVREGAKVPEGARVLPSGGDTDRMAELFKQAGVTTIAEFNAKQKSLGFGLPGERERKPPPKATQAEIDEVLPLLQPLPESYRQAILAIPGCLGHIDTRHIKTILRLNPKHAMAALHEFREAMEDIHSSIRNKGGYMMGVLRKYLPGEAASGVTYDGTKISTLENAMLDTDTYADPYARAEAGSRAKAAAAAQAEEERLRKKAEDDLRKSPQLPSDILHVQRFVKKKTKECVKHAPNLLALHAWEGLVEARVAEDAAWPQAQTYASTGGRRKFAEADAPLVFSSCEVPRSIGALVSVLDEPPHVSLHASRDTVERRVVYRYDRRTALVHEKGAILAPFQAPHDRSVIIAWRHAPPALGCAAGSWLRLRFSVTSALVPETTTHRRCPVVLDAWLLEPVSTAATKVTTWSAEELPEGAPAWLNDAQAADAAARAASFARRLAKHSHLDEAGFSPPGGVPAEWDAEESTAKTAETKATAADREEGEA